jgi:hypothetical protein
MIIQSPPPTEAAYGSSVYNFCSAAPAPELGQSAATAAAAPKADPVQLGAVDGLRRS